MGTKKHFGFARGPREEARDRDRERGRQRKHEPSPCEQSRRELLHQPQGAPTEGLRLQHEGRSMRSLVDRTRQARHATSFIARAEDPQGKKLTRESEPDQYWMDANTKSGKSPLQDPLALIGIFAILSPFIILAIAILTGYVELGD